MKNYFTIPVAIFACTVMLLTSCREDLPDWYFTVTVTSVGSGTGTASPSEADKGAIIELTATPDEGYAFTKWTVTSGNVELEEISANPATFSMPSGNVTVQAEFLKIKPIEEAVYHEGVGAWVVPQNDPYALDNFQQAYNNLLAAGLTRAGESSNLTATHYALKIFPRNEDEQWEIELMEDVRVSYIPFNYAGLNEEEAQKLEGTSERPVFPDANPHIVTNDDIQQTIDSLPEERVSQVMPILYAVWPVDRSLPNHLDYELDYAVFLPFSETRTRSAATWSENTLQLLENEAIRLALGYVTPRPAPMSRDENVVLSGDFEMWEVLHPVRVPIPRIKVKFHLGSNIIETDADESGHFSITANSIPADASWDIIFQNPKWKVTRENSTIPKNFFQGEVYQTACWSSTTTNIRPSIQPADATIINALNYYYYTDHTLSKWEVPDGIRVIAHSSANSSYNGLFTYTSSNTCYITIYRNNTVERNKLAGTVWHELGHFIQFKERGSYNNMRVVDRFLQESFASYVGNYMTEKYYEELGYIKNTVGRDISGQARQMWRKTLSRSLGYYSPFFVDLVDNFNQASYFGPSYNNDEVKGLHYSVIMRIAKESVDWASCKRILREESDQLTGDLETFLEPYDEWFAQ